MPDRERYDEFVALLQQATGRILTYANALLLNWNDAEDVFQETCAVLWQKFDDYRPGTNFTAWALCIAQNKAMDFQKSRARRHVICSPELQEALIGDIAQTDAAAPDDGIDALAYCMNKLSETDRRLAQLCYGDGMRVREVADQLGRSPQSVHNSLRRIRMVLLECIERATEREARQ